jgi:hypothetical protein
MGRYLIRCLIHDFSRLARSTKDLLEALSVQEGKYKGRKEVNIPDFKKHNERYMRREVSKIQLAKEFGITRPTLDK